MAWIFEREQNKVCKLTGAFLKSLLVSFIFYNENIKATNIKNAEQKSVYASK
jgi:hypothetical protein